MSSSYLRIGFILAFVWMFAFAVRLQYLSFVEINSDSLSSYLGALRFWRLGFSHPPNPESDHWMWITKAPWLWCASSLDGLFRIRFFIGASIAPMAAWCAWYSSTRYRYISAIACGMLVALDKGLIDTLTSSFRGYMAPEWISIATVLVVLSCRYTRILPMVGVCVVIASGHHPMASGALLGVLWLCRTYPKHIWWMGFGIAIAGIFRSVALYQIMQCDAGGLDCIRSIAFGSAEEISTFEVLVRILHDRFWVEMGWSCGILLLGLILSPRGVVWKWCVFSCLGVVVLGLFIDTLRPYHFRAFVIPMLVSAIHGMQKCRRFFLPICTVWIIGLWFSSADIIGIQNQIEQHDEAAQAIQQYSYPIWMESLEGSSIFVPAVGLSMALSGFSLDSFSREPGEKIIVFSSFGVPSYRYYQPETDLINWGGGHDWATSIYEAGSVTLP